MVPTMKMAKRVGSSHARFGLDLSNNRFDKRLVGFLHVNENSAHDDAIRL